MAREVAHYSGRITPWHSVRPKFRATVEMLTAPYVALQEFLETLPHEFDIDYAIGKQLDIVGEWVGRSRFIEFPLPDPWFSYDDNRRGWDVGIWKNETYQYQTTAMQELDDETYRRLLYAKVMANNWDGTTIGASETYQRFFSDAGSRVFVLDFNDLKMTVAVAGRVPQNVYLSLLANNYLPLKPGGVKLDVRIVSVDANPPPAVVGYGEWDLASLDAGLLLDLDGSVASSVVGSTPITSWRDLSSYGKNATAFGGREPSYAASIKSVQNGIVTLDHSAIGAEWNVFIVSRRLGDTSDYRTLLQGGGSDHHILTNTGSGALGTFASAWTPATGLTWNVGALHLVRCKRLATGTSLSLDGGPLISTGALASSNPNYVGGAITGGQTWGDVHQIVFLPVDASSDEVASVEGFLARKWDAILGGNTLVAALAGDHLYKNSRPLSALLAVQEGYSLFGFDVDNEYVRGWDQGAWGVKPEYIVRHGPILPEGLPRGWALDAFGDDLMVWIDLGNANSRSFSAGVLTSVTNRVTGLPMIVTGNPAFDGSSMIFDGVDDRLEIWSVPIDSDSYACFASASIDPAGSGSAAKLAILQSADLTLSTDNLLSVALLGRDGTTRALRTDRNSSSLTSIVDLIDDVVSQIGVIYSGGKPTLYVNGVASGPAAWTQAGQIARARLLVGANAAGGERWKGRLREMIILKRVPTQAEMTVIWSNLGKV